MRLEHSLVFSKLQKLCLSSKIRKSLTITCPISLLSNIEKIYEKVMYSRVTDFTLKILCLTDTNSCQSKIRSLSGMVFLKVLCWVCCYSWYTSMICTWQLNFLKTSILQTIPIHCILQQKKSISLFKSYWSQDSYYMAKCQ